MNVKAVDWFYVQNGKQIGPVPVKQFDELIRSGRIPPETLVWREGLVNWQPFSSIDAAPSPVAAPRTSSLPPGARQSMLPGALADCAECGLPFPLSEMIPFGGSWICARCKPIFFQRVREGAPLAGIGAEAWQSGDAVVTLHGGALPARCAKCNGAVTGPPIVRTFYWQPQWLLALLVIPLVALFVWFVVRKPVVVSVPICEECRQRRRTFIGVGWSLVAVAAAVLTVAISMESGVLIILAFVIASVATCIGLWKGMLIYLRTIDAQHIWMRGFSKDYMASLPEFRKVRWP